MIERRHSRRTPPPPPSESVFRFRLLLSIFNCRLSTSPSINSFPLISFADPHLLNTVVSYPYENHSREEATLSPAAQSWHNVSSLNATLPSHPSMCCKQRSCTISKSFKCNTYKKHRGLGVVLILSALILNPHWIVTRHAPSCLCPEAPFQIGRASCRERV